MKLTPKWSNFSLNGSVSFDKLHTLVAVALIKLRFWKLEKLHFSVRDSANESVDCYNESVAVGISLQFP